MRTGHRMGNRMGHQMGNGTRVRNGEGSEGDGSVDEPASVRMRPAGASMAPSIPSTVSA